MTTQRIRKNASKKINELLNKAYYFEMESHSMGLDDCMNSNSYTTVSRDDVDRFMDTCYGDLIVELKTDKNLKPVYLELSDGPYYFCKRVYARFTPEPIEVQSIVDLTCKPRVTMAAVKAYLDAGFISPLCHEGRREEEQTDDDKKIIRIKVLWSESGYFNRAFRNDDDEFDINMYVSMEDYARVAAHQVSEMRRQNWDGGYYKTKVEITTANGEVCTFRHDVCPKEPTLAGEWAEWVDYCRSEDGQRRREEINAVIERAQTAKQQQAQEVTEPIDPPQEDNTSNMIMFPGTSVIH